ncbi:MAG: MFS transporter [Chloroflexi bacterium]|nr:MFS transporter [Chloroflexota bacterium]MDA1228592.1 MFS transporter [Chloroflexota bacterium]
MIAQVVAGQLLRSLRTRNYRQLWYSDNLMTAAEQMEFLVLAWYVVTETSSPFWVTLFAALRFTGTMFAPFYGIIVDRYDRKKLLVFSRLGFAGISLCILALSFTGQLQIWHVFVLTALAGMGRAFDNVTRQTFIADLVKREELSNAVALTRTGRDATQIFAPVVGGLLLDRIGLNWTYILVMVLHLSGVFFMNRMRPPERTLTARGSSILSNLTESFRYAGKHQIVLSLLLLAFLVNLTGFPMNLGLTPVYAKEVLETTSAGLGQLLGAYSAGAFVGSIAIASIVNMRRLGRFMVLGAILWHLGVLALSQTSIFGGAMAILALSGFAQSFSMVTMAILLLGNTSSDIRGRIQGLRSLAVYGLPIGLLISGAVANGVGVSTALAINGVVGMVVTALIVLRLRGVWRLA